MKTSLLKSMAYKLIATCDEYERTQSFFDGIEPEATNFILDKQRNKVEGVLIDMALEVATGIERAKKQKELEAFYANQLRSNARAITPPMSESLMDAYVENHHGVVELAEHFNPHLSPIN